MSSVLLHCPASPVAPALLDEMFRQRHEVFKERLGWEVSSFNGMERDCYDLMSAVYGICVAADGTLEGAWRLIPTTGPCLLSDAFPQLLDGQSEPRDPRVWECSRFSCRRGDEDIRSPGSIHRVAGLMIAALLECGIAFSVARITAVCDLPFERILGKCGLDTHRFGVPHRVGKTLAVAGWFDVTEDHLAKVCRTSGVRTPIFTTHAPLERAA